jgi:hypothetical protein
VRVLGGTVDPEEVDSCAHPEDEVVVAEAGHVAELDFALVEVDRADPGHVDGDVLLVTEQIPQRMADRRRLEQVGSDLVQQGLEVW